MLEEEFNIEVREFTVAGYKTDDMFAHKWFLGTNDTIDPVLAQTKIDSYLKVLNDDYRTERIAAIKSLTVELLPVNLFYSFMKLLGKEGGQNKFPRVLKNDKLAIWEEFLRNQKLNNI